MHRVVRPFPVSWDGLTLVSLQAGDEREFGDMAAGLEAEGYIEPVDAAAPVVAGVDEQPATPPAPEHKRPYKKRK